MRPTREESPHFKHSLWSAMPVNAVPLTRDRDEACRPVASAFTVRDVALHHSRNGPFDSDGAVNCA